MCPETFHGDLQIPNWLMDMVFAHGGRFSHNSIGPMAYLVVIFEPNEVPAALDLKLLTPTVNDDKLVLSYHVQDIADDVMSVSFTFQFRAPEHLRTLALMGMSGSWRLDLLAVDADGRFTALQQAVHRVGEASRGVLLASAARAVRERFRDPDGFLEAFRRELLEESAAIGFSMVEQGKAEELNALAAEVPTQWLDGPSGADWREYADARDRTLHCQGERVRALDANLPASAQQWAAAASASEDRRKFIRQRLRGRAVEQAAAFFRVPRPEEALDQVCGPGRCVVHFTMKRGAMVALWAMINERGDHYGQIEFPRFNLDVAVEATNQWLATEQHMSDAAARQSALDRILEIASTLAIEIASTLLPKDIRHLVLCPTWFLELWPLHCAVGTSSAGELTPLCDLFEAVTYTPSFRVLAEGVRRTPQGKRDVAAIGYYSDDAPLPNVDRELQMFAEIFPGGAVFTGPEATPAAVFSAGGNASILHIACHGDWHAGDALRSGLLLYQEHAGKLYVPDLLSRGRFGGVELAVLSACSSGRNLQATRTFQEYRGVDGAFLYRGASAVVSSLWEVDDLGALLMMTGFYAAIRAGATIDAALRHAIDRLRTSAWVADLPAIRRHPSFQSLLPQLTEAAAMGTVFEHPYYWGAFKSSGVTWRSLASFS